MIENATSLTSSADADADGPVVGRHLEDVGLDDLAVPQVRLQPHLVPRLRTQVAQQHRCIGKKKERYRINQPSDLKTLGLAEEIQCGLPGDRTLTVG